MRGASARMVGSANGLTSSSLAGRLRIGTVNTDAVGFDTVAANRRPSALTESEVYFSNPKLARRVALLSTSSAHNHGPEPLTPAGLKVE